MLLKSNIALPQNRLAPLRGSHGNPGGLRAERLRRFSPDHKKVRAADFAIGNLHARAAHSWMPPLVDGLAPASGSSNRLLCGKYAFASRRGHVAGLKFWHQIEGEIILSRVFHVIVCTVHEMYASGVWHRS